METLRAVKTYICHIVWEHKLDITEIYLFIYFAFGLFSCSFVFFLMNVNTIFRFFCFVEFLFSFLLSFHPVFFASFLKLEWSYFVLHPCFWSLSFILFLYFFLFFLLNFLPLGRKYSNEWALTVYHSLFVFYFCYTTIKSCIQVKSGKLTIITVITGCHFLDCAIYCCYYWL